MFDRRPDIECYSVETSYTTVCKMLCVNYGGSKYPPPPLAKSFVRPSISVKSRDIKSNMQKSLQLCLTGHQLCDCLQNSRCVHRRLSRLSFTIRPRAAHSLPRLYTIQSRIYIRGQQTIYFNDR